MSEFERLHIDHCLDTDLGVSDGQVRFIDCNRRVVNGPRIKQVHQAVMLLALSPTQLSDRLLDVLIDNPE